ncbi:murein biosynthesis integral membrane protein MurJ [Paenibacillus albicereus]|uniref:Probable lipid II flippase MurJ n=1 Tax=Paenibacillus albicereus TaxID=2726185 RepID=A0A6H2GVF4_9BACL|nr:murein biosynthesis integral membrane protein MurJ [Paenibacillus albicereus]QJC51128.1 murein biosynthesis integral membrane protein MurJ [Paenibacillus albicereus]
MKRLNEGFFNATILVIVFTLLGRALGFVREQIIAGYYGTSLTADVFVTAFTLPQYISNIFGGVITIAFIPLFLEKKNEKSNELASNFSLDFFFLLLKILIVYAIIAVASSSWIIDKMFFASSSATFYIYFLMIPVTLFMTLSLFFSAYLNAQKSFIVPTLSPLVMSVFFIFGVIIFPININSLVWSSLISAFIALAFIVIYSKRAGFNYNRTSGFEKKDYKNISTIAFPMAVGSIFLQSTTVIDKFFAKQLPEGSIAALNYAFKLTQLPSGIFATAISTLIFPTLAVLASQKNEKGAFLILNKGIRLTLFITLPAIIILLLFSKSITELLFERGAFNSAATQITSNAVVIYSIGILGTSLTMLISRYFYARKNTWIPVSTNVGATLLNVLFSFILVERMGYLGLATSYSISVSLNFVALAAIYGIKQRKFISVSNFKDYSKIVVSSCLTYTLFSLVLKLNKMDLNTLLLFILIIMVCVVYFVLCRVMKTEESIKVTLKLSEFIKRSSQKVLSN